MLAILFRPGMRIALDTISEPFGLCLVAMSTLGPGSDIDVDELKGDAMVEDDDDDVARVCNAVARGDLSQKITVVVQGVVMVQLKDVINTMVYFFHFHYHFRPEPSKVDKLGQFAKEVTRVSQEVGTEGQVPYSLHSYAYYHKTKNTENSADKLSFSTSKVHGES